MVTCRESLVSFSGALSTLLNQCPERRVVEVVDVS
jgi:hypothetical protein